MNKAFSIEYVWMSTRISFRAGLHPAYLHFLPRGVICLISALAFQQMTTQVSHAVYLAIGAKDQAPVLRYPPLQLFWYSKPVFENGVTETKMDGVNIRIYSAEKTRPAAGLAALDVINAPAAGSVLAGYHLLPSVRGGVLMKMERFAEAREKLQRAITSTQNLRERELLTRRLKQMEMAEVSA